MDTQPCRLSDFLASGRRSQTLTTAAVGDSPTFTLVTLNRLPPTFGEGNLGRAGVNIVANRLLAAGATPRYIAASLTIDTDTPIGTINAVGAGLQDAAVEAEMEWTGIETVFTDTGLHHGLSITLFGVGELTAGFSAGYGCMHSGDVVICTGPVGTFGTSCRAIENGLTPLFASDGESLGDGIHELLRCVPRVHGLFFPQDGVNRIIDDLSARVGAQIRRADIPVLESVKTTASLTGVNPLDMPCAGTMIVVVAGKDAADALAALRRSAHCTDAVIIGRLP